MKKSLAKVVSPCTKGVDDQIQREKEAMSDFPFNDVRTNSGKSRVMSGPSHMASMRSNKRYKPGDYMEIFHIRKEGPIGNVWFKQVIVEGYAEMQSPCCRLH